MESVTPDVTLRLRDLTGQDLPAVTEIEAETFTIPWTRAMFASEIGRRNSWTRVALSGDEVVGYLICRHYGDIWHIMDVAVRSGWRRRGVARSLLGEFMTRAVRSAEACTLEVRAANIPAQQLYLSLGFRLRGRRKGYYDDTGEDALVMTRSPCRSAGVRNGPREGEGESGR